MDNVHKLPTAMDDSELLDELFKDVPADPNPLQPVDRERWARMGRDCEARRARMGFRVV